MYPWTRVDDAVEEAVRLGGAEGTVHALIGIAGALNRNNELLERIANALETSTDLAISQDYWRRVEQQEEE